MKKKHKLVISICAAAVIAAVFVYGVKSYYFSEGPAVVFQIKDGATGAQVARDLKAQGIIKSEFLFKLFLKFFGNSKKLKSGSFDLYLNTPAEQVIACISNGACLHLEKVTVIEGWRAEEIAMALEDKGVCDNMDFTELSKNKEGYLYPSTYLLQRGMPPQKVIDTMTGEFDKRVRPLLKTEFMQNLSEHDVITLASIVEREAVNPQERPLIAAVYLNRLKKGQKLEADPTVQYSLGYTGRENRFWKRGLTLKDLKFDSPYNTYVYSGLPPGPICSPSMESIYAVLHPEQDFDALYFVAEKDGTNHVFSRTFKEHEANIRRIRGN
ncbi:MAG: endolytic transglycosylase MltG [Elusimicrobia bacterium]|nr:endolytic transglycosylase MltG [Elusimicrobiota bacterium]